jgi:hypothetical protein
MDLAAKAPGIAYSMGHHPELFTAFWLMAGMARFAGL